MKWWSLLIKILRVFRKWLKWKFISKLSFLDRELVDHIIQLQLLFQILSSGAVRWIDLVEPADAVPEAHEIVVPPGPVAGADATANWAARCTAHKDEAATAVFPLLNFIGSSSVFASIRNLGENGEVSV